MEKIKLICLFLCLSIATMGLASNSTVLMDVDNRTTTYTGTAVRLHKLTAAQGAQNKYIARLDINNDSGVTPTADVVIQHSADCATWATVITFSQVTTGSYAVEKYLPSLNTGVTELLPCVRAIATLGGTSPQYDMTLTLNYN